MSKLPKKSTPEIRLRCTSKGHAAVISKISWSPCGNLIASTSLDETIRVWDANTGNCLKVLKGHRGKVCCLDWTLNGKLIASAGLDKKIKIWQWENSSTATTLHSPGFDQDIGDFTSLFWAVNDRYLVASSCISGSIYYFEPSKDFHLRKTYYSAKSPITCLVKLSKGNRWAIGLKDGSVLLVHWEMGKVTEEKIFSGHKKIVNKLIWSETNNILASCSDDHSIRMWPIGSDSQSYILEGHTAEVNSISINEKLLVSQSQDNTVRIWSIDTKQEIAKLTEPPFSSILDISFNPKSQALATIEGGTNNIHIWDLDAEILLDSSLQKEFVRYISAKIVLVGESNVGKSCLAMRLAEERYPKDHEHGTTHGMQFWSLLPTQLSPDAIDPKDQRRDITLWDLGGQKEYQLIHQLFIHDTTLALMLLDPTRDSAFEGIIAWNKRLEKQLEGRNTVKILVGTKMDEPNDLVDQMRIKNLLKTYNVSEYIEVSALNGRNITELKQAIIKHLDWKLLSSTTRPKLFQHIRDEIDKRRDAGDVVLLLVDLIDSIRSEDPNEFEESAVRAVALQLATQGVITLTQLSSGEEALILQLPEIERYAGSLIIGARNNPHDVPALEERILGSPELPLPGISHTQRLPRIQERIIIECVAQLLVKHGICFQHKGLLVFPSLFKATEIESKTDFPYAISLYYDFSGAIENIYASLVAWLVICENFGKIRLWKDRVEFEIDDTGACGLRKVERKQGFAHLDVYFEREVPQKIKEEFISFVDNHLRQNGIEVVEKLKLICQKCRYEFPQSVLRQRIARSATEISCSVCDARMKLSKAIQIHHKNDKKMEHTIFALRTKIEKEIPRIANSVKERAFERKDIDYKSTRPIYILHISDLHFTEICSPQSKLQWLVDDLSKTLQINELDYLVISGDITYKGNPKGFKNACNFVSSLIEYFKLSAQRCIFVPGNHDVQDLEEAYVWRQNLSISEKQRAVKQGDIYLIPNKKYYNNRLKKFSELFYHPIIQKPYPSTPEWQGVAYTFPKDHIQFISLNSCWEIDQFHRKRSSIHPDAVANLIKESDSQIKNAIKNSNLTSDDYFRIGVWHHSVVGPNMMKNIDFLAHLQKNNIKFCLTGDVHEVRRELMQHWHKNKIHVVGAGSFGAPSNELPSSTPRLYNLIEIRKDLTSLRVHTRQQKNLDGPWSGWNEWPRSDGSEGGLPRYDLNLSTIPTS